MQISERKKLIKAALGQEALDLVIRNVRLVNVYTGRVERADLGIRCGRIVSLDAANLPSQAELDGAGRYAIPGLMDAHMHVDSTLLTPAALASLVVPHGTTTLLADPMEISNVAGLAGVTVMREMISELPFEFFFEVSSRVPTAPGLETTGGELGLEEVKTILTWPESASLGELDPSKVLGLRDEYLAKVEAAHALGKITNGHAAGLTGQELEAYVCGGLSDDHECVDYKDAFSRLRLGLPVLVREGSSERNLEGILRGVVADKMDTRHLIFCTDDKHPDDILREGHINYMVNKAIALGVEPVAAIQMATLNTAIHFHLEHELGSLAPGRIADILLCDRLDEIHPAVVLVRGQVVAENGHLTVDTPQRSYPDWLRQTVKVSRGKSAADFALQHGGQQAHVRVIDLVKDQIINTRGEAYLPVRDGVVQTDTAQDVLKLVVVERYGKNGNIGIGFVRGFELKNGALASSVSHDHHNIVVVGTNDTDIAACVRAVEVMQGGLAAAVNGQVVGTLALPLGGLMSEKSADQVIAELKPLGEAARQLGCPMAAPFMTLSFISLPTVPELGLTDKGLVDVFKHTLISSFIED
jgi:adenine deaminase